MRDALRTPTVRRICLVLLASAAFIPFFAHPAAAQQKLQDTSQQNPQPQQKPQEKSSDAQGCQTVASPLHQPDIATIEAIAQHQVGSTTIADGCVDILYKDTRLRADHVEYDDDTKIAKARGHVQLDHLTQHLEADDAEYNLSDTKGTFHHVRGTLGMQRRPNPQLLISPNPLYFEAQTAIRLDEDTYRVYNAWITVCEPGRPTWKYYARRATVKMQDKVRLVDSHFRLLYFPLIYLPYATFPATHQRESGFMIPDLGNSSIKGYFFGDSYYWAPKDWVDTTIGATYLSKRGWSQNFNLRMRPWENAKIDASYFGVFDRGLPEPTGPPLKEGGHEMHFGFDAFLKGGWRTVADLNELSSLTFRLAFAETFSQAVNSEVRNTAFATNNFSGFSVNVAALSYKNFFGDAPETDVYLRTAPEVRVASVDQELVKDLPLYFSIDAFTDAVHRSDTVTGFDTPSFVERSEIAPNVTLPLHWGPWLSITPSFTLRATRYGAQLGSNGTLLNDPFVRTTEEFSVDIRPPALERIWRSWGAKWKHTIEPYIDYRYVNGVNDFGRYIRFDEDDTLTDTNEVEYGIHQRLFRKGDDDGQSEDFISWDLKQKYFIDPTFGGALDPGVRNVFQAVDSLTPFAFADAARLFSPIVSDIRITPGHRYDTEFIVDYDPKRGHTTAIGALLKLKPYRESFVTLAQFSTINLVPSIPAPGTIFEPRSDQIRTLFGYGDMNRRGWNTTLGFSYDLAQKAFQNQIAQVSYNGSCCGIGLEYRRLALGTVRSENQYRIVLLIANLGSAGNLKRQEKVF